MAPRDGGMAYFPRFRTRLKNLGRAPLRPPPHREGDHHGAGEAEPGDGVLHMVVLEMHFERAGFWDAAIGHRRFEIDIERRHLATPAERPGHRLVVSGEP